MSAAANLNVRADAVAMPAGEVIGIAREYLDAGRFDAAERLLGHVLASRPGDGDALHLKGFIAFKRGRPEAAAALIEQALAAGARNARVYCNLAEVYRMAGRLDEALTSVRRAAALAPTDATCHFNTAMVHYDRLEIEECIRAARRALALKPDLPEAHMRLGQALLLVGDFAEGWEQYEWRYQIAGAQPLMPQITRPQWDGRPLGEGERLLLVADQGYGDVFMFVRYLPWAMERCRQIAVACSPELRGMLARLFPGPEYFSEWARCPPYVAYCPLSGLPRLHRTRLENIPAPVPYLHAEPGRVAAWTQRLDQLVPQGLRRVGIAWAGRPTHNNDRQRSMRLRQFAPLAEVPGMAFLALQKGPATAQIADWPGPAPLINLDSEIKSFEDTAAIMTQLDLTVIVDTSIGHLGGGLGLPVWVMLPFAPDWRWLMGRADSPWYPTLRLFRQEEPGAWEAVVQNVAQALALAGAAPTRREQRAAGLSGR